MPQTQELVPTKNCVIAASLSMVRMSAYTMSVVASSLLLCTLQAGNGTCTFSSVSSNTFFVELNGALEGVPDDIHW